MRAFRSIGFAAKAAWVSAAFLLPLVVLTASLWVSSSEHVRFAAKERLGVAYARTLMPLLDAAQNQRRAAAAQAPDLAEAGQKVAQAMQGVASAHQNLGEPLGLGQRWEALLRQQQALAAKPVHDSTSATFQAHTAFIQATLALIGDVADSANLSLDPGAETYALMEAGLFKQPLLVEYLGQMRGMGNALIGAGSKTPEQHDTLTKAHAFALAKQAELDKALTRAVGVDPLLASQVQAAEAVAKSEAFLGLVKRQVLVATPSGDAKAYVGAANEAIAQHYAAIGRVLDTLDARLLARQTGLQQSLYMQLGAGLLSIALAIYLLTAFYRVTQGGIAEVARQLDEISAGNLTLRPQPWGRDEVAQLMNTLSGTSEALCGVVRQVREAADEVQDASAEVASASLDLSQRTEQAAGQLQRTSAAMSQIGSTLEHTAQTASGASDLVVRNAEVAAQGGHEVGQVVSTMGGIKTSSARIEDIIGTIDSIAFQTNILALNAAVEAARAGEQGRGFAVVASEVRALAGRSAEAAREIKRLITASVEQIESGSRAVGQAGDTMAEIVGNASHVKDLIGEISHGTQEQTKGLAELSQSVEQIDAMTQQNAALVEQTAATAASLNDSARRMNESMAYFQVN